MSNTVIATNVLALNSHRALRGVGTNQARSVARLSSGYRINSAADDAAGLAISEKMRAQIRGLDQASRNSQDAISLIQTAEGGMQEVDNMLQRIRELLVQASNDTNENNAASTGDRQKIQDEINQLVMEIDSMANRVEFNRKTLISGDFSDPRQLVNMRRNQVAAAETDRTNATVVRDAARTTLREAQQTYNNFTGGGTLFADLVSAARAYFGSEAANNLRAAHDESLEGLEIALESVGIMAADLAAFNYADLAGATINSDAGAAWITINSVRIDFATTDAQAFANVSRAISDFNSNRTALTDSIATPGVERSNFIAAQTAFNAVNSGYSGDAVNSWRFIEYQQAFHDSTRLAFDRSTDASVVSAAAIRLNSARNAFVGTRAQVRYNQIRNNVQSGVSAVASARTQVEIAQNSLTRNNELLSSAVQLNADTRPNSLYFQIGANAFQGMEINIGSVATNFLGIGDGFGNTTLDVVHDSGKDITIQIATLDEAMSYIGTERSRLGAAQNRLEHTIRSLDISSENLSASESRIRDADMAREMMAFTQSNVLQQAAISMLAQANQAPQNILQLL